MAQIDKIDAFSLVIKTLEKGDEKKANEMMRVIQRAIRQDQKMNRKASLKIEIKEMKDARLFWEIIKDKSDFI